MSQELDRVKEVPEEDYVEEVYHYSMNGNGSAHTHVSEIMEEPGTSEAVQNGSIAVKGSWLNNSNSLARHQSLENGSASGICSDIKESAIRRETEGEFRLLGRREGNRFDGSRLIGLEDDEHIGRGRRVSFSMEDNRKEHIRETLETGDISATSLDDEEVSSDGEYGDGQDLGRRDPEIVCRNIDHVDMLGLNKTTLRLRFLINWLVTSLLQLKLPVSDDAKVNLVHIYGPKIKYERGAAVAFNLRDKSRGLINPEIVQKLAEKEGISLGIGILSHIKILDSSRQQRIALNLEDTTLCRPMDGGRRDGKGSYVRLEVVTASLGFLTNFEDVYKLWAFVAKFLNPTFIIEGGLPTVQEDSET
jgi:hypothetical protein